MENFTEARADALSKTELIYSITANDGVPSAATLSQRVTHHSRSLSCAALCSTFQANRRAIIERNAASFQRA